MITDRPPCCMQAVQKLRLVFSANRIHKEQARAQEKGSGGDIAQDLFSQNGLREMHRHKLTVSMLCA